MTGYVNVKKALYILFLLLKIFTVRSIFIIPRGQRPLGVTLTKPRYTFYSYSILFYHHKYFNNFKDLYLHFKTYTHIYIYTEHVRNCKV